MRTALVLVVAMACALSAHAQSAESVAARVDSLESVRDQLRAELSSIEEQLGLLRLEVARLEAAADSITSATVKSKGKGTLREEPHKYGEVVRHLLPGTEILVMAYAGDNYWKVVTADDAGYMSSLYIPSFPDEQRMIEHFETSGGVPYSAHAADELKRKAKRDRSRLEARVAAIPLQGSRRVTMAAYNRLKTGVDYITACEIIGFWGTEISRSDVAGYTTVMYSWTNPNGSNMNAMFQNGGLVTKAQGWLP